MKIVSLGGNAILKKGQGTIEEQYKATALSMGSVAELARAGSGDRPFEPIVITHGNGPVVGNIVLRNEMTKDVIPPMPLYVADADSEGEIGFLIQQALYNELLKAGVQREVVSLITQVVVSEDDPAFQDPTKPIGPYYNRDEADELIRTDGWVMQEGATGGFRRAVASPRPVRIVESNVIKTLASTGVIVIAAGGGGVPVVEDPSGRLSGIDAVVDKDFATSALARDLKADTLIILTAVDMVYSDFNGPNQKGLETLTVNQAENYLAAGEFPPGSMGPKIEAAIEFLKAGGKEILITSPECFQKALKGTAGTRNTPHPTDD